jgi:hypothetical protein
MHVDEIYSLKWSYAVKNSCLWFNRRNLNIRLIKNYYDEKNVINSLVHWVAGLALLISFSIIISSIKESCIVFLDLQISNNIEVLGYAHKHDNLAREKYLSYWTYIVSILKHVFSVLNTSLYTLSRLLRLHSVFRALQMWV